MTYICGLKNQHAFSRYMKSTFWSESRYLEFVKKISVMAESVFCQPKVMADSPICQPAQNRRLAPVTTNPAQNIPEIIPGWSNR